MASNVEKHIKNLKLTYGSELYFKNIDTQYKNWIENVNSETDKRILNDLFFNIKFFSKVDLKKILRKKLELIKKENDGLRDAAIVPIVPPEGRYCGANELIGLIKEIDKEEQLNDNEFLPYKDSILNDLSYTESVSTIILVDDISGTGETFSKFIDGNIQFLVDKKVIFLFIGVTRRALEILSEVQKENDQIDITFDYGEIFEKVSATDILSKKKFSQLIEIEKKLWKSKKSKYILGYKRSELLVLFSHNIPNNTISSLWFKSNDSPIWNNLFTRIAAPSRKRQNYTNKKRG